MINPSELIELRSMTRSDLPAVLKAERNFPNGFGRKELEDFMASRLNNGIVAVHDNLVMGYALYTLKTCEERGLRPERWLEIHRIWSPSYDRPTFDRLVEKLKRKIETVKLSHISVLVDLEGSMPILKEHGFFVVQGYPASKPLLAEDGRYQMDFYP